MKIFLVAVIVSTGLIGSLHAAVIQDVSPNDRHFGSIQKSVNEGYLSLSSQKFNPDQAVSRREVSVIIDKLSQKIDEQHLQLTQAEMQELLSLAKNFKTYLAEHETNVDQLKEKSTRLKETQDTIQISNAELVEKMDKTNKKNTWLIGGAIVLGVLGLIVN